MRHRSARVSAIGGVITLVLALCGLIGCGSNPPNDCTQGPVAIADFGTSVAVLGDSYAAGEGTFNTGNCSTHNPPSYDYYATTQTYLDGKGNVESGCHRSPGAFAPLVGVALENFVACSGATTGDVETGSKGFHKQINVLNARIRVVVLSVTGDNIGFGSLGSCIDINYFGHGHPSTQAECDQAVKQSLDSIPKALANLVKLWATIETMTHGAWIIQLGYPRVFPSGGYDGGCNGIIQSKQKQLNNVADTLDSALQKNAADYPYVKFVDTVPTFAGHEVCGSSSGKPYINDLQTNAGTANNCPTDYIVNGACSQSFHPNAWGYEAEAQLLKPVIAQLLATSSPSPSPASTSVCSSQTFLSVVRSKGYAQSVTPSGTPTCAGGYALETFVPYTGGQQAQFFFKKNPDGTWTIIEGGNAIPTIACRAIPAKILSLLGAQCPPAAMSPPPAPASTAPPTGECSSAIFLKLMLSQGATFTGVSGPPKCLDGYAEQNFTFPKGPTSNYPTYFFQSDGHGGWTMLGGGAIGDVTSVCSSLPANVRTAFALPATAGSGCPAG
jgi:hypothetical protein